MCGQLHRMAMLYYDEMCQKKHPPVFRGTTSHPMNNWSLLVATMTIVFGRLVKMATFCGALVLVVRVPKENHGQRLNRQRDARSSKYRPVWPEFGRLIQPDKLLFGGKFAKRSPRERIGKFCQMYLTIRHMKKEKLDFDRCLLTIRCGPFRLVDLFANGVVLRPRILLELDGLLVLRYESNSFIKYIGHVFIAMTFIYFFVFQANFDYICGN